MGVIEQARRDAQKRPEQETSDTEGEGATVAFFDEEEDPFVLSYLTDRYQADYETIDQILTATIALGNLL